MKEGFVFDLNRIMEEVFGATENFKDTFRDNFGHGLKDFKDKFQWDENIDYYPAHSYPPANVYLTPEKELVLEFALAGFDEKDINIEFKGDYMILSANVPEGYKEKEAVRHFKKRLKFRNIEAQKYYVPENKFNRNGVKAVYKNGLLRVVVPPNEEFSQENGIKVEIVTEEVE